MSETKKGWIIFLAAMGLMAGLLSNDIRELTSFNEMYSPSFLASFLAHFGTVIGAFVAGRLIPTESK